VTETRLHPDDLAAIVAGENEAPPPRPPAPDSATVTSDGLSLMTSDEALDRLADLIAARIESRMSTPEWLDSKSAARYLSVTPKALYHYIDRRGLPSHQDEPGGKLWFKRSELDTWRAR
jgi:excisionase family DNA binding protein